MKLDIVQSKLNLNMYYIYMRLNSETSVYAPTNISFYLDISEENYVNILKTQNVIEFPKQQTQYYFKTYKEAELVVKLLEPYLVMATLIGE